MKKIVFLFFILLSNQVFACDCPPLETFSKELSKKYDVIFYGTVDSIIPCRTEGIGTAYFTISSLYKGHSEQHVSVDFDCTSDCMMSFAKGDEWIIYGIYQRFDLITVNFCSPSRKKENNKNAAAGTVATGQTFEEENAALKAMLGIQPYGKHNELNDMQKEMAPHNEQPSAMGKVWLLLISLGATLIVYFISRKFFKNDK